MQDQSLQLPTVKELVKDNTVKFSHYRAENFYYNLTWFRNEDARSSPVILEDDLAIYQFPVDIDEIGNATMLDQDKAITFMRWIRKAHENGTLIKL